jgi:tRNA-dihydrouridine synthase B
MTKTNFPKLKSKAILAPMAGVTDVAFRELCRKYGAGLSYTEFVNSIAIVRKNVKTIKMLKRSNLEKPSAVQIFGSDVEDLKKSAEFLKDFDVLDVNCGCPAGKVIKTGAGSELLKNPDLIGEIVRELKKVHSCVSVKIRIGVNDKNINAMEIATIVEKSGADAIAIHGRTQKQGYSGEADWNIIKKIKSKIRIPVIGNGDVDSPERFVKALKSGVDYVMIGRGAIGNPYLFKQINDFAKTGKYSEKDKLEQFFEYYDLAKKYNLDFVQIKTQAIYFTKGLKSGAKLRKEISQSKNLRELIGIMRDNFIN